MMVLCQNLKGVMYDGFSLRDAETNSSRSINKYLRIHIDK